MECIPRLSSGSESDNFESLCRNLIRLHFGQYGKFKALSNQPGVEFHIKLTENCALGQAMAKDNIFTQETVAKPGDKEIPIMYTGAPVKDKEGNIVGALEYVADITDIKNRENYLQRNTKTILDAMNSFASGDLTVNVNPEIKDDDIGRLFDGFNKTIGNIRLLLGRIRSK